MEDERYITRKYERDIDLLLAEEFSVNPAFVSWFVAKASLDFDRSANVVGVYVSKSDSSGESDLVVVLESSEVRNRFALHIEDKIDAPFQPDQCARYHRRASSEIGRGDYAEYKLILCCPQKYSNRNDACAAFDQVITYESIADWLVGANPADKRLTYRAEFLKAAAVRAANLWERTDDEDTNRFWRRAFEIAHNEFPKLELRPLSLTKDSTWITVRPSDFPTRSHHTYVALKGGRGLVDLTFSATTLSDVQPVMSKLLAPGMSLHQTGKATALRLVIDAFSIAGEQIAQEEKVRKAFGACVQLIDFYREHRNILDQAMGGSAC